MLVQCAQHDLLNSLRDQRYDQIHDAFFVEAAPLVHPSAPTAALPPLVSLAVAMMVLVVVVMVLFVMVLVVVVMVLVVVVMVLGLVMMMPAVAAASLAITIFASARMVVAAHGNLLGSVQPIMQRPVRFVVPVPAAPHQR